MVIDSIGVALTVLPTSFTRRRESRETATVPWIPDLRFAASGMTHLERRCSDGETGHFRQRHLHLRALPALRGEKKKKCRTPAKAGIHRNCHSSQDSGSPLHRVRNDGLWDNPVLRGKAVVPGKQAKAPSPSCSSCLRGSKNFQSSPWRGVCSSIGRKRARYTAWPMTKIRVRPISPNSLKSTQMSSLKL